mgnify:CR=1 FL=1
MAAYSMVLRKRVLADCDAGMKTKPVAEKYGVSRTWVRGLKQKRRETGDIAPGVPTGRPRKIDRDQLAALVKEDADATLAELRERLGVKCSLTAIWMVLDTLRITFKKKTLRAAEQERPDVAEKRAAFRVEQLGLDPRRLVFIDETWATTNMTRLRGRSPRGERVIDAVPHGHWKTTTLIAALDLTGIRCSMVLDGAVNRLAYDAFVEQVLVPTLRPNDLVVMDNLSSHKGTRVAELIRAAGAELVYLPPYSPDLNPIEPAFSKIKQALRSLASRTMYELWGAVQSVLDRITPSDASGFYRHCGYATGIN